MVSQNKLFTVKLFHHLGDCDLYTPPRGVKGRQNQPGQNQELVPKRETTSVAWTRVLKHCSLIQTDFKPLKHKQQSYMRALSRCLCERSALFSALLALNNYINTYMRQNPRLCKYPYKHSDLGLKREKTAEREKAYVTVT